MKFMLMVFIKYLKKEKNTKYKNSPLFSCLYIQTWIINCSKITEKIVKNNR